MLSFLFWLVGTPIMMILVGVFWLWLLTLLLNAIVPD